MAAVPPRPTVDPYLCQVCSMYAGKDVWHVVPSLSSYHLAAYLADADDR